jgi:polyisoprenoid-binding protein YceI
MTATAIEIPGYIAGTWQIDPAHTDVAFSVRHLMISKVRGAFRDVAGTIATGADPLDSFVTAEIALASVDTGNDQRDAHLRSPDFFDVDNHPTMTFRSTRIRSNGAGFDVDGELAIRGVTRPVTLALEITGMGPDAYGGTRAGFSASTTIDRTEFGLTWNAALETGGVVVSDLVTISLDVQAVLQP